MDVSSLDKSTSVGASLRQQPRILVVDDCAELLDVLHQGLVLAGYEVGLAESLARARSRMNDSRFELVLSDVCLPDGSGLDLLDELAPSSPEVAVIMMTGTADHELAIDSLRNGAFDFIAKPFRFEQLLKVVRRALSRQGNLVIKKQPLDQRLETMARFTEDVHNPVFQVTASGKILYANKATSYLRQQWSTENEGEIPPSLLEMVCGEFAGEPLEERELTFGERTYSFNVTEPINGRIVYLYGFETTELKATHEDLLKLRNEALELARTDHLTGLPNRLDFAAAVSHLEKPGKGQVTAIVMMDVNNFKQINDNFGHGVGDRVLVAIGHSLRRQLRPQDLVFRWGGDEILLIICQIESKAAVDSFLTELTANIARDVRSQVPLDISLGSGFAFWPEDGEEIEQVLIKADASLVRGKSTSISTRRRKRRKRVAGSIVHSP